ncbi:DUF229 domain-containing protein [Blastopirellula marina]|uniref:Iduronate-2-sulfatase n=2 Tax=Blastopirellula marina TaxID=124 RepID=A0A2S8FTU4_9BACT|nr:iduronate-2-sulfatase [Blastopirellula marina]PTL44248.1 DUF229 domain-containing protein [Blastopirellula marina]
MALFNKRFRMNYHRPLAASLLIALVVGIAVGAETPALADRAGHPNVLLICVDDLRPELGCYGAAHVRSPNIDRLANSGVTFDRCYVQVAVCNPSRASTFTGIRPDRLGVWTLPVHFREASPNAVTLPQHLSRHGYVCEGFGKIFHNPWQDPRSWTSPHRWGQGSFTHYTDEQKDFTRQVKESLPTGDWRKENLRGLISNAPEIEDDEHPDGDMTRIVAERLAELSEQDEPFFLAVGYVLPHLPWCPPKRWWDQYDRSQLPLAENPNPPTGAPPVALGDNYELSHYADMTNMPTPLDPGLSEAEARRFRHAYYAAVSFVDAQIGRLLQTLRDNQLADDTIVVLWSDHGWKLGEHNAWGKMTNFEIDTRIPLLIYDPRAAGNGERCSQIIESLDLYPTLCELTGTPIPSDVDGKSAAHLLSDPTAAHAGVAFSQYVRDRMMGRAIRTDRWRYVEWRTLADAELKHRELYDQENDPGENHNVVEQHPEIAAKLKKSLDEVLVPRPISLVPAIHSAAGGKKMQVRWANEYEGPVRITWISPRGERRVQIDLKQGESRQIGSFVGHRFAVESEDGKYHEVVEVTPDQDRIPIGRTSAK